MKSVVPAVKALVVKELVEKYNLRQEEVAKILGISQSAVSKYTRNVRGYVINVERVDEVKPILRKITRLVLNGEYSMTEFLMLFCNMCNLIRKKGLMCDFCRKTDKRLQFKECNFCLR